MITTIILAIVCLIVGCVAGYAIFRYVIKAKYNTTIAQAELEAKNIKEKKLLQVKEEFVNRKAQLDKEVQQRNQNLLQAENKLKQREISINQRQDAVSRRKSELDSMQSALEKQTQALQRKEEEVAKLAAQEREKLEAISGLSASSSSSAGRFTKYGLSGTSSVSGFGGVMLLRSRPAMASYSCRLTTVEYNPTFSPACRSMPV